MNDIKKLLTEITQKVDGDYLERVIKIFNNLSTENDIEIIKAWLKSINDKL